MKKLFSMQSFPLAYFFSAKPYLPITLCRWSSLNNLPNLALQSSISIVICRFYSISCFNCEQHSCTSLSGALLVGKYCHIIFKFDGRSLNLNNMVLSLMGLYSDMEFSSILFTTIAMLFLDMFSVPEYKLMLMFPEPSQCVSAWPTITTVAYFFLYSGQLSWFQHTWNIRGRCI